MKPPCACETRLQATVWLGLAAVAAVDCIGLVATGIALRIDETFWTYIRVMLFIAACAAVFYCTPLVARRKGDFRLLAALCRCGAVFCETLVQFMVFLIAYILLSYLASASPYPLYDAVFLAADEALGFYWRDYVAWVNRYPWLAEALAAAYRSLWVQVFSVFILLSALGRHVQLLKMMAGLVLCAAISLGVAWLLPSVAVINHLSIDPADYPNVPLLMGHWHLEHVYQLREGSLTSLGLDDFKGIITFPSLHAAFAVILAWSYWSLRLLRWPAVLVNILVLASTPVIGGHYLVDVIAGVAIALPVIAYIERGAFFRQARVP